MDDLYSKRNEAKKSGNSGLWKNDKKKKKEGQHIFYEKCEILPFNISPVEGDTFASLLGCKIGN